MPEYCIITSLILRGFLPYGWSEAPAAASIEADTLQALGLSSTSLQGVMQVSMATKLGEGINRTVIELLAEGSGEGNGKGSLQVPKKVRAHQGIKAS